MEKINIEIRKIGSLPEDFGVLENLANLEGFRFLEKMKVAWVRNENRFDREGEVLVAAFLGDELIGVCGRNIDPYTKEIGVARVRHLYVRPEYRGLGVGRSLVLKVVDGAANYFNTLRLRTDDENASEFYLNMGFRASTQGDETHFLSL